MNRVANAQQSGRKEKPSPAEQLTSVQFKPSLLVPADPEKVLNRLFLSMSTFSFWYFEDKLDV